MKALPAPGRFFASVGFITLLAGCGNNAASLTPAESAVVKDSVLQMTQSIAKAVSEQGPLAWSRYFENSADFYMAADGQLAFSNTDSMTDFLKNIFTKSVKKITLSYSQVRIDPYSSKIAGVAATYHEDITDTAGKISPSEGYFTAIAEQTTNGWQLRNAHWSTNPAKMNPATKQ
jgi:hypothetical protein